MLLGLSLYTDINHKLEERKGYKKDKEDKGTSLATISKCIIANVKKAILP
jgi:hypothetical protein